MVVGPHPIYAEDGGAPIGLRCDANSTGKGLGPSSGAECILEGRTECVEGTGELLGEGTADQAAKDVASSRGHERPHQAFVARPCDQGGGRGGYPAGCRRMRGIGRHHREVGRIPHHRAVPASARW